MPNIKFKILLLNGAIDQSVRNICLNNFFNYLTDQLTSSKKLTIEMYGFEIPIYVGKNYFIEFPQRHPPVVTFKTLN